MAAEATPLVVIAAGSDSDMPHINALLPYILKNDAEIRICSAHKQPGALQSIIDCRET